MTMLRRKWHEYLANKGWRTWGFFERCGWRWADVYDYDCPMVPEYVERRCVLTRYGRWRQEWNHLRRVGITRYKQDKKWQKQMQEMMRSTVRLYTDTIIDDIRRGSPFLEKLNNDNA